MLKASGVNYCHGSNILIRDFSFEFVPGKIYGVVGLNGSGKTTLLKILAGIWTQTSGSISWNAMDLLGMPRMERSRLITMVPQTPHVSFDYTVYDVVAMGGYARGDITNNGENVLQALDSVEAKHLQNNLITEISSGEKQRVFIARALITESPTILLDEPTASLDIKHKSIIWDLLVKLKQQNKVVLVTTHDLDMAEKYCDELILMDSGGCLKAGPFAEVINQATLESVFSI